MNPVSTMSTRCHQHQEQHPLHDHHHHDASSGYHRHHRHSPKSQSIPIQRRGRSSLNGDYYHSQRIREEEMMADYVDYCFCERLVSGMQRKVSFQIHDVSLRYENQALIDHIIMTRRGRSSSNHHRHGGGSGGYSSHDEDGDEESSPPSSPPISPTLRPRIITAPSLGNDGDLTNQRSSSSSHIEDEMIFDMEL